MTLCKKRWTWKVKKMFSGKVEAKLEEIQNLEQERKLVAMQLNDKIIASEKSKNEVIFKTNELGDIDNKLKQGYIALSKLLTE